MNLTDYAENKLVDALFRGQPLGNPSTWHIGLSTDLRADNNPGAELSGGSYARQAVAASLANWAGTQGAGTTAASSGTSGTTSNNVVISFPESTAAWGTINSVQFWDAASGGNCWKSINLSTPFNVSGAGITVKFNPATLSFQIDD